MAVRLETVRQRFIGLSTDTKPTGVPVGSTFEEYDTKDFHVTYDGTSWSKGRRNSAADQCADWRKNIN